MCRPRKIVSEGLLQEGAEVRTKHDLEDTIEASNCTVSSRTAFLIVLIKAAESHPLPSQTWTLASTFCLASSRHLQFILAFALCVPRLPVAIANLHHFYNSLAIRNSHIQTSP